MVQRSNGSLVGSRHDSGEILILSHNPTVSRRNCSNYCHLHRRRQPTSTQSICERARPSAARVGQHDSPVGLQEDCSYRGVVVATSSSSQLHPLDYLQRQPSSRHFRPWVRRRSDHAGHARSSHLDIESSRTWMAHLVRTPVPIRNLHPDRCLERHVRGKLRCLALAL